MRSISVLGATGSIGASTLDLIRQIEDALCASTAFVARPADEPTSLVDQDLADPLYGSAQTFDLWVAR